MSCFSTKIDLSLTKKLMQDLPEQGFVLTQSAHTLFVAKKKGIVCTLYASGTLTVQGKDMNDFIEFYLEPEILQDFSFSYPLEKMDTSAHIGVDESGKGDFFGPLCISALFADTEDIKKLVSLKIKDSKQLSDQAVLKIGKQLEESFSYETICISPIKYNEMYAKMKNLNLLLGWGHATAIEKLYGRTKCAKVIIDQFAKEHVVENALKRKNISVELRQMHRAEVDIVVAGASILARYSFIQYLKKLSQDLGFDLPKGASNLVKEVGKKIVQKHGASILSTLSKTHFKTTQDILYSLQNT